MEERKEKEGDQIVQLRETITYKKYDDKKPSQTNKHTNQAGKYAREMLKRSWVAQTDGKLLTDMCSVLEGGCIYLQSFFCDGKDLSLLCSLIEELQSYSKQSGSGMVNWSQHLKFENPDFSPTFQSILKKLESYFDVEILATRLNFYKDGSHWKPFHHDSHAYSNGQKEDFTMGASFGSTRDLAFKHPGGGQIFSFPQANGDIFAFDTEVNKAFQHGVPRAKSPSLAGPRVSIIAWGRRRTLNERNSSSSARKENHHQDQRLEASTSGRDVDIPCIMTKKVESSSNQNNMGTGGEENEKVVVAAAPIDMNEVVDLVEKMVVSNNHTRSSRLLIKKTTTTQEGGEQDENNNSWEENKTVRPPRATRRGRVQHGWALA